MYDDRTLRGWPLPNKANTLAYDVERIRETINSIDKEITAIETQISGLSEEFNNKIAELRAEIKQQNVLAELGFYIDEDGDLAQKTPGDDDDNPQYDPENPTVLINGQPATLTTSADIQELLNELNFGQ